MAHVEQYGVYGVRKGAGALVRFDSVARRWCPMRTTGMGGGLKRIEQWQKLNIVADDVAVVQGDRAWCCREGRAYERTGTEWVERTRPLAWCG